MHDIREHSEHRFTADKSTGRINRPTDIPTDRQTNKHVDRQTDRLHAAQKQKTTMKPEQQKQPSQPRTKPNHRQNDRRIATPNEKKQIRPFDKKTNKQKNAASRPPSCPSPAATCCPPRAKTPRTTPWFLPCNYPQPPTRSRSGTWWHPR